MARSIQTIYDSMVAEGIRQATDANLPTVIDSFNNTSSVAIWKIYFWTVAFCINAVETIFDAFRVEIDNTIATEKPHSARWYAGMAKKFQYGYNLVAESDYYDNSGLTEDQINASLIVAYAAVVEQDRGIRIKVAKIINGDLGPLAADELTSFQEYMEEIKDAGIKLLITTADADDLSCVLRIYYNPLVLNGTGGRIDGTENTPVQDSLKNYLLNLPFNGLFVPQLAVDQLELVDGVVIAKDDSWQAKYGALDFSGIDVEYNPDSGFLRIDDSNLNITFIPHGPIQ